jgi:cardiolipin synthase
MTKIDDFEKRYEEQFNEFINNAKKQGRKGIGKVVYGRMIMIAMLLIIQVVVLCMMVLRYQKYAVPFYATVILLEIVVVLFILNSDMNPMYKLSWIIPVVAVPVFGTMFYIFFRLQASTWLMKKRSTQIKDITEKINTQDEAVLARIKDESKDLYNTSRYMYNTSKMPVYDKSDAKYFPMGEEVFKQMVFELEQAREFIFIEYFIIENGVMWDTILEILKKKVSEGVEVRVMYDGTCNVSLLPNSYPKQLKEYGIKAKVFSPIIPILSVHQNNRDHRKIMVIDGRTAFTGGVNLADEYINVVERFGVWKDNAIMITGAAVSSFTIMFLQLWNLGEKTVTEDFAEYIKKDAIALPHSKGYIMPYGDSPIEKENRAEQVYFDIINQAKDYVYITTPYLILDNEMTITLKAAARRGVDVRIYMPHIPDKKYVFYLGRTYYPTLLEAGVRIFEYRPGFIHAKTFVSDDVKAVVGSINLDYRSLFLHFECGVYVYGNECINEIRQDIEDITGDCIEITPEYYKSIPAPKRLVGRILRLLAPMM